MRFGVFFLSQAPQGTTAREVLSSELRLIACAEELGFESVWVAEHHFSNYCLINDPLAYAGHIAAFTERIRIGVAVSILPLHHPLEIAERSALVDILSNGRLNLGVGRGYSRYEFCGYGVPIEENEARFEEALDIIVKCWTREKVDYEGRFWSLNSVSLFPAPVQKPHPTVFLTSSGSPRTLTIAAERAFPFILGADLITPQREAEACQVYLRLAADAGRAPEESELALSESLVTQKVYVASTTAEARSFPEPYVMWRHRHPRAASLPPPGPPPSVVKTVRRRLRPVKRLVTREQKTWEDMQWEDLLPFDLYGTPDDCIARIREFANAGAGSLLCWFSYGGMPEDKVRRAMELFAKEVMPAFQSPIAKFAPSQQESVRELTPDARREVA